MTPRLQDEFIIDGVTYNTLGALVNARAILHAIVEDRTLGVHDIRDGLELVDAAIAQAEKPEKPETFYTGHITHKHGRDDFYARTQAALFRQLAEYAREYWSDADLPMTEDGEPNTGEMNDEQIITAYFDVMDERGLEWYETGTATLED